MQSPHLHPLIAVGAVGLLIAALVAVQPGPAGAGSAGDPTTQSPATATDLALAGSAETPFVTEAQDVASVTGLPIGSLPPGQAAATSGPSSAPTSGVAPAATSGPTPGPAVATNLSNAGCPMFPSTNVWNKDISTLPVAANSAAMVEAIGLSSYLHPDFDAVGDGIPYNVVTSSTPKYKVTFDYAGESDAGPYPIPASPKIEGGSDAHMILLDKGACRLYELYAVSKSGSSWQAGSGAIWNLRSNALRPAGWTSADAAGLPILPGLVLYSEVRSGVIRHAIRFTAAHTCGYIYPARHLTAPTCSTLPPMGLRVRLKASVDISRFGPQAQVVLTALKKYGMILADNGSPWYISGEPNSHWNDDQLHLLQSLTGSSFEVVNTSSLRNG